MLLPAQDLKVILAEVLGLRAKFERFKKMHNDFAVRTSNEIDELFAKVEAAGPTMKEAGLRCESCLPPIVRFIGKNCPSIRKQPNSLPVHIESWL